MKKAPGNPISIYQSFDELASEIQSRASSVGKAHRHERFIEEVANLPFLSSPESVILVGGTNGKGSVSHILERLWTFSGEAVGLMTSPHLVSITERLVKEGAAITEKNFLSTYQRVAAAHDLSDYSFSECMTLMALYFFFHPDIGEPVDRAVFEVGVGGLNDSVNAIPHAWAVLTQVGGDHQALLGRDLLSRFHHKVGIAPAGGTLVLGALAESLHKELHRHSEAIQCRPVFSKMATYEKTYPEARKLPSAKVSWRGHYFETHTAAPAWIENISIALTAFEEMGGDVEAVLDQIPRIRWPGRWQYESTPWHSHVLFSGDHNLDGWSQLAGWLHSEVKGPIHILFALSKEKSPAEFFGCFQKLPECVFYGIRHHWKSHSLEDLSKSAPVGTPLTLLDAEAAEAFRDVCERAAPQDLVVVTGSLYGLGRLAKELSLHGFHLLRA